MSNHLNFSILEDKGSKILPAQPAQDYPFWYSPDTGICHSKYPAIDLPSDPFLDVVSCIFSKEHHGVSALIETSTGCSISYAELYPLVKCMACGLQRKGIAKGEGILVMLPNSICYPIILLGALYLGAIVTTLNPSSTVPEIKQRITEVNVSLAFTTSEHVEVLQGFDLPAIGVPEVLNPESKSVGFDCFYELLSESYDLTERPAISQQDTALILYSSGTTGTSKGVVLTHRNLIAMLELFVRFEASQYEYSSSSNVYLAVVPMFHIYGLSLFAMGLLSLGSAIVIMRKFDIDEVLKAIERYGITHFPLAPPILKALIKRVQNVGGRKFQSLRQISCGAAPLSKKVIEEFVQLFRDVDFIQGYGSTECSAVATRGFNTEKIKNYTSVGLLAPSTQAKVVDWNNGSFLPPGSCGELLLRGPGVMKEYLNNVEATASTIDQNGWLRTGDIVYFDQDGYLYILDRLKEMIKYKGFQIAPADLEAVLITHPEIVDAAVTAVKDEECGEIPVAFVVKEPVSVLSPEDVINYVAQQVAPYKKVRKVVFTQSIPKSASGKILRRELIGCLTSRL